MTYKKILVPLDFSDCSENALKYAITFAQSLEAKLLLLHAYHIPIPAAETGMFIDANLGDDFVQEANAKMVNLYQKYPVLDQLTDPYKIKVAFASEAILSEATANKVDLIIMGTHGASNAFDELVGSNTMHVVKGSKIPVLAIPNNYSKFKINQVLFAFDYQNIGGKEMIQPLIDFALSFGAKIHILHITDRLDRLDQGAIGEAKMLDKYLKNIPHHYHMLEDEHVEEGIKEYIKDKNIDVLAVMPRKHTFFQRMFQSSVTRQLVHHSSIPLLAFHE